MERLPFRLPEFLRVNWTSAAARARWESVFAASNRLIQRLEFESVRLEARALGLVSVAKKGVGYASLSDACRAARLELQPLYSLTPRSDYLSQACHVGEEGAMGVYAVGQARAVLEARGAFERRDSKTLGSLLGYPSCCVEFFVQAWDRERHIDTTWPMACNSAIGERASEREFEARAEPGANVLLRYVGVRPVFHLPCAFDCPHTLAAARLLREVARQAGEARTMDAVYEILDWPVVWSALHGIAEIETPVARIVASTDATAKKFTVHLVGDVKAAAVIAEAAYGNRAPYRPRPRPQAAREMPIRLTREASGR